VTSHAPRDAGAWVENKATTGWIRLPDVGEVLAHRRIAWYLALRNVQLHYKQTLLGIGWTVLQPLIGTGLFTVIFGGLVGVPSDGKPYAVFVLAGLLGWGYFSRSLTDTSMSVIANEQMVTKIYFPRLLAPLSGVLPGLLDFAVGLPILAIVMVLNGVAPSAALLTLPLWLGLLAVVSFGLGCLLAAAMVTYRDVAHALPFLVQLGLFATPVVYPSSLADGEFAWAYHLNPVVAPIDGLRWALIGTDPPGSQDLLSLASGAILVTVGVLYFCRVERRFADII
jgi:lipopolysaccharide transport system permease protein